MIDRLSHDQRCDRRKEIAEAVRNGATVEEVAQAYRLGRLTVRNACLENGVEFVTRHRGRPPGIPYDRDGFDPKRLVNHNQWESADWNKRDAELARHFGVSRERVRQKRNLLGKPKVLKCASTEFIEFRDWVNAGRDELSGLAASDIHAICPVAASFAAVKNWCKKLGIGQTISAEERITSDSLPSLVRKIKFRDGLTECWEFLPSRHRYSTIAGYPAHWYIYKIHHGEKPEGAMILHRCDNKKCVNPDHIYAGTAQDNADDRARNNPDWTHRISKEQAIEMRRLHACGKKIADLSDQFGFAYCTVWAVIRGRTHSGRKKVDDGRSPLKMDGRGCSELIRSMLRSGQSFTCKQFTRETGYRAGVFVSIARAMIKREEMSIQRRSRHNGGSIYGPPENIAKTEKGLFGNSGIDMAVPLRSPLSPL